MCISEGVFSKRVCFRVYFPKTFFPNIFFSSKNYIFSHNISQILQDVFIRYWHLYFFNLLFQFSVGEELIGPNLFAVKLSRLQHLPSFCELVQILRAQREAIVKYPEVPQEPRSASKYLGRLGRIGSIGRIVWWKNLTHSLTHPMIWHGYWVLYCS